MSAETFELAAEAVAAPGWRWLPGMLDTDGVRYCTLVDGRPHGTTQSGHASMVRGLPDLDDAATLGCLLALVREAWGVPSLQCGHVGGWDDDWDTWQVSNPPGRGHGCCFKGTGPSEEAALVAALRGAP